MYSSSRLSLDYKVQLDKEGFWGQKNQLNAGFSKA